LDSLIKGDDKDFFQQSSQGYYREGNNGTEVDI